MKRCLVIALVALALPLVAAEPGKQKEPKQVAVINGETITSDVLDQMYGHLSAQMRAQYDATGGKAAFLENYLRKRLLVQEAIKAGFDKRPDVQLDMNAAKESALFDRYVRDVVASQVVTDAEMKKFYDENPGNFATPERVRVRHIVVTGGGTGPHPKSDEEALAKIEAIATELHKQMMGVRATDDPAVADRIRLSYFSELARKYSEDGSAQAGGDLGWVVKGQLDPVFEEAAFKLEKGVPSGIVKTRFGYHIILVEDKQAAGTESFESAKAAIREWLMAQHAEDVMQTVTKLTNELRSSSKIAIYPENIN